MEEKQLIDSIRKHAGFKRLAAYSIQSLVKKCSPPSNGWQESARSAFAAGATDAVAAVLDKNSKDSEIFLLALTQLQASAVVGLAGSLLRNGNVAMVMRAFREYLAAAELPAAAATVAAELITNGSSYSPSGPHAEGVAVTESFLRFMAFLAVQARAESSEVISPPLLSILPRLPTPNAVRLAFVTLENLSRCEAGLSLLSTEEALGPIIEGAATIFTAPGTAATPIEGAQAARRTLVGRLAAAASAEGGDRAAASSGGGAGPRGFGRGRGDISLHLNAHIDPAFRLLDRVSRDASGLGALRANKETLSKLAHSVEFAQVSLPPAVGALGVRILARVLGNDVASLLSRLAAAAHGAAAPLEAEFSASLLASLSLDGDVAASIAQGGGGGGEELSVLGAAPGADGSSHLGALVALFAAVAPEQGGAAAQGPGLSAAVGASLAQTVRRVVGHSSEYGDALASAGCLASLLRAVARCRGDASLVTEGLVTAAALIEDEQDVGTVEGCGGVGLALTVLREQGAASPPLASACLEFIYACQCAGLGSGALISGSLVPATLGAMTSPAVQAASSVQLQVYGTLVLTAVAETGAIVDAIVAGGGITVAVSNLHAVAASRSGSGGGASGGAFPNFRFRSSSGGAGSSGRLSAALRRISSLEPSGGGGPGARGSWLGGGSGSPGDGSPAAGGSDGGAGAEDGDGSSAATAAARAAASASLTSSSLNLLGTLCSSPAHVAAAKARGLVRAMLGAYTCHPDSDEVFEAFCHLVDAAITEDEVTAAVRGVAAGTAGLRSLTGDPVLYVIVEQELGTEGLLPGVAAAGGPSPGQQQASKRGEGEEAPTANSVGLRLTEDLCLLEAVSSSTRLAGVLLQQQGVQVVTRCIGIVAMIKAVGDAPLGSGVRGGRPMGRVMELAAASSAAGSFKKAAAAAAASSASSPSTSDKSSLLASVHSEVLSRCCATLTGLARLHIEAPFGVPGLDPVPTSVLSAVSNGGEGAWGAPGTGAGSSSRRAAMLRAQRATATAAAAAPGGKGKAAGVAVPPASSPSAKQGPHSRVPSSSAPAPSSSSSMTMGALQGEIAGLVYRPVVLRTIIKALSHAGHGLSGPSPPSGPVAVYVAAACVALGVLVSGGSLPNVPSSVNAAGGGPLEVVIGSQGVEAVTGVLRTFSASLGVLIAAANALGYFATAGRPVVPSTGLLRMPAPPETVGSSAVVTRGATRQAIRELQSAASGAGMRWHGNMGQAALCALLRMLLGVADTAKGAELLKKQGLIDALILTLDASASAAVGAEGVEKSNVAAAAGGKEGARGVGGGPKGPSRLGPSGGKPLGGEDASSSSSGDASAVSVVETALRGGAFSGIDALISGGGGGGVGGRAGGQAGDGGEGPSSPLSPSSSLTHGSDASTLIVSILSRLMDAKDLAEAVRRVQAAAAAIATFSLSAAGATLATVALTTVLALAGGGGPGSMALSSGSADWSEAVRAISSLLVAVQTADAAASAAAAAAASAGSAAGSATHEAEAKKFTATADAAAQVLPPALRALSAIFSVMNGGGAPGAAPLPLPPSWRDPTLAIEGALVHVIHWGTGGDPVGGAEWLTSGALAPSVSAAHGSLRRALELSVGESLGALKGVLGVDRSLGAVLLQATPGNGSPPSGLSLLVPAIARLQDSGPSSMGPVALAIDSLLQLSRIPAGQGGPGSRSGVDCILACEPAPAGLITRALADLLSSATSGAEVGAAMELLARLCAADAALATATRTAGLTRVIRTALQRFCGGDAGLGDEPGLREGADTAPRDPGAVCVLTGASALLAALVGHAMGSSISSSRGGTSSTAASRAARALEGAAAEDRTLLRRLLTLVGDDASGTYVNANGAMTALSNLVFAACTPGTPGGGEQGPASPEGPTRRRGGTVTKEAGEAARALVMECEGRSLIVTAMSSHAATPELLQAGTRALAALGDTADGGAAQTVRRAVAVLRGALRLSQIPGLLPAGDPALLLAAAAAAAAASVSPAGSSNSPPGAAAGDVGGTAANGPSKSRRTASGGAGGGGAGAGSTGEADASSSSPSTGSSAACAPPSAPKALAEVETACRNLAALLAGDDALTATTYRYAFDTLTAALEAAAEARRLLAEGRVPGVVGSADAPGSDPEGGAAPHPGDGPSSPSFASAASNSSAGHARQSPSQRSGSTPRGSMLQAALAHASGSSSSSTPGAGSSLASPPESPLATTPLQQQQLLPSSAQHARNRSMSRMRRVGGAPEQRAPSAMRGHRVTLSASSALSSGGASSASSSSSSHAETQQQQSAPAMAQHNSPFFGAPEPALPNASGAPSDGVPGFAFAAGCEAVISASVQGLSRLATTAVKHNPRAGRQQGQGQVGAVEATAAEKLRYGDAGGTSTPALVAASQSSAPSKSAAPSPLRAPIGLEELLDPLVMALGLGGSSGEPFPKGQLPLSALRSLLSSDVAESVRRACEGIVAAALSGSLFRVLDAPSASAPAAAKALESEAPPASTAAAAASSEGEVDHTLQHLGDGVAAHEFSSEDAAGAAGGSIPPPAPLSPHSLTRAAVAVVWAAAARGLLAAAALCASASPAAEHSLLAALCVFTEAATAHGVVGVLGASMGGGEGKGAAGFPASSPSGASHARSSSSSSASSYTESSYSSSASSLRSPRASNSSSAGGGGGMTDGLAPAPSPQFPATPASVILQLLSAAERISRPSTQHLLAAATAAAAAWGAATGEPTAAGSGPGASTSGGGGGLDAFVQSHSTVERAVGGPGSGAVIAALLGSMAPPPSAGASPAWSLLCHLSAASPSSGTFAERLAAGEPILPPPGYVQVTTAKAPKPQVGSISGGGDDALLASLRVSYALLEHAVEHCYRTSSGSGTASGQQPQPREPLLLDGVAVPGTLPLVSSLLRLLQDQAGAALGNALSLTPPSSPSLAAVPGLHALSSSSASSALSPGGSRALGGGGSGASTRPSPASSSKAGRASPPSATAAQRLGGAGKAGQRGADADEEEEEDEEGDAPAALPVGFPSSTRSGAPSSRRLLPVDTVGAGATAPEGAGSKGKEGADPSAQAARARALEALLTALRRGIADDTTRLLALVDMDVDTPGSASSPSSSSSSGSTASNGGGPSRPLSTSSAPPPNSPGGAPQPQGPLAYDERLLSPMDALLTQGSVISVYRALLRQRPAVGAGDVLAAAGVQVVRRVVGLNSPSLKTRTQGSKAPPAPSGPLNLPRVARLAAGSVFARVAAGLTLHSASPLYAREAVRLLKDLGLGVAAALAGPGGSMTGALLVGALGLTAGSMKALQSAVKRFGEDGGDPELLEWGSALVTALSEVFESLSGKGFLDALTRAVEGLEATPALTPGTPLVSDLPPPLAAALGKLRGVCEGLEPDGVPPLGAALLHRATVAISSHLRCLPASGTLLLALARASDHASNAAHLGTAPILGAVALMCETHRADAEAMDAALAVYRACSVQPATAGVMRSIGAIGVLCAVARVHMGSMLPVHPWGQPRQGPSPHGEEAGASSDGGAAPPGPGSPPPSTEPRIAHSAVQCLANLACDQTPEPDLGALPGYAQASAALTPDTPAGAARIIIAGGVEVLKGIMESHLDRPRLLEDALCAMSNLAYSTDAIRLLIGRSCANTIVTLLRLFNGDAFLFSMALRAVGNLTRCDENIVGVVAYGVIGGIIEGMARNAGNRDVLQLAADVIGNLASIDEKKVDRAAGWEALRLGQTRRNRAARIATARAPAPSVGTAGVGGGAPPPADAPSPAATPSSERESLLEAVNAWLLDDGADRGLVEAMLAHSGDAEVVSACLRSLQYVAESRPMCERMQASVGLAAATCRVVRSCDFDAELCIRGSILLGQLLRPAAAASASSPSAAGSPDPEVQAPLPPAAAAAYEAGAANVLLSVLETHRSRTEVFNAIARVLVVVGPTSQPKLVAAASELSTPSTLLWILEQAAGGLGRAEEGGAAAGEAAGPRTFIAASSAGDPETGGGASGAGGCAASPSARHTRGKSIASAPAALCRTMVHTCFLLLRHYATVPALVTQAAGPLTRLSAGILGPGPASQYDADPSMVSLAYQALAAAAAAQSEAVAASLVREDVMRAVAPLATHPGHMEVAAEIVEPALALMQALAASGPAAALYLMDHNGHGVAQAVAAHWALHTGGSSAAQNRRMYGLAGAALRAMLEASEPLRLARAAAAAAREDSASSAVEGGAAPAPEAPADPKATRKRAAALEKEERLFEKAQKQRQAEAAELAKLISKRLTAAASKAGAGGAAAAPGPDPSSTIDSTNVLETRAGLIPWELFPSSQIEAMVVSDDVAADVWFSASMFAKDEGHPAAASTAPDAPLRNKCRRMKLQLSPDLKVLTWSYPSRHFKREVDWSLPLASVASEARMGVASGPHKKKRLLLGRVPKEQRGVCLDGPDASTLLHLETVTAEQQASLLRALAVACAYARAREGVPEPLPTIRVSRAALLQRQQEQQRQQQVAGEEGEPPSGPPAVAEEAGPGAEDGVGGEADNANPVGVGAASALASEV